MIEDLEIAAAARFGQLAASLLWNVILRRELENLPGTIIQVKMVVKQRPALNQQRLLFFCIDSLTQNNC